MRALYPTGMVITPDVVGRGYALVTTRDHGCPERGWVRETVELMAGDPVVVNLDTSSASPGAARTAVRAYAIDHGLDGPVLEAALVVASELVSNAVQHGEAPTTLCIEQLGDAALRIEVCDAGESIDRLQSVRSGDLSMRGSGLAIVADFATDWWVERRGGGKSVIAEIEA